MRFLFTASMLFVLAACETTSSRPYKASTENILAIQQAMHSSSSKVQIGNFTAADGVNVEPTCRAMGALEVAPGQSPVTYIKDAFQEELFNAGVYDITSGMQINAQITELKFNSFGTGSWTVAMKVSSDSLPEGYTTHVEYSFKTSFSAISACQNVIDAFQPTVSELLNRVVRDPNFVRLAS